MIILSTLINIPSYHSDKDTIGFVGLMVPHMVRILAGPDHRGLIPCSFCVGGVFLMLTDTLARVLAAPLEIPVGVITALLGTPFFIYLIKRRSL